MVKLSKIFDETYSKVIFVTTLPVRFHNVRTQKLAASLSPSDQNEFPFDMKKINWKECLDNYCLGVKKYLLKEDCSAEAIKKGQLKLNR